MPLVMLPMMPTKPWSVPQMNRFVEVRAAIELLFRRSVHGAVVVAGVTHDRCRREHIGIDHVAAIIGHESHGRLGDSIVPPQLFQPVRFFIERAPTVEVGQGGDPHRAVIERRIVSEIVRRADHATAHIAQFVRLLPDELVVIVEECDRAIVANLARRRVERGDRFAETSAGPARATLRPAGRRRTSASFRTNRPTKRRCGLPILRRYRARRGSRGHSRPPSASPSCAVSARRLVRETSAPSASRISRTPAAGRPNPSKKMLRNMIENCPQSISCSRAEP